MNYETTAGDWVFCFALVSVAKSFLILGIVKVTACMGCSDSDSCASCGALLSNVDFEPKEIKK